MLLNILAMAQLDTKQVLAQPWDQAWESLHLGFQSEEPEGKKYVLSHLLPPSPPHSELHCYKAGAPFMSPASSCKQLCCCSQPSYPKVSVAAKGIIFCLSSSKMLLQRSCKINIVLSKTVCVKQGQFIQKYP